MNEILDRLRGRVPQLVANLQVSDEDRALDERDSEPFDTRWVASYDVVRGADLDDATKALIDQIRELAFKGTYAATRNPELAGYVSDDFELIARHIVANTTDGFVNALLREYLAGRFPTGHLALVEGILRDLV